MEADSITGKTMQTVKSFWHGFSSKLLRRIASPCKKLAVRETASLGDRRFVSVIQFERQRFLIACSPTAVTLLAHLPDELAKIEEAAIASRQNTGEKN
jgi:flagellar biogenesis protein FliO